MFQEIHENEKVSNMFNNQNHHQKQQQQQQQREQEFEVIGNFMSLEDMINFNPCQQKNNQNKVSIPKPLQNNMQKMPLSLSSLEILRNHGSRFNKKNIINTKTCSNLEQHQMMSTEEIIRVAGTRYTQYSSSHWSENICIQTHPYGFDFHGLTEEQNRDIELAQFLFSAAERVTAIGVNSCKDKIEETGKNLASFAVSLNLPFLFKAILVEDMLEIKEDDFQIEEDEAVAVYSPYFLRTLISRQESLENLMRVIMYIKPSIMIVLEIEASLNSPSFVNRFVEALFHYSAFFDILETCIKEEDECRMMTEGILSAGIRNIVATEGSERNVRNVKIDVWRKFFARYRMVETRFSEACNYQAELVVKKFDYGNFCNVEKNGKCLILGWKGTPMHSISAWRFL
ncbi:della protein gai1-like protein [Trifolium pratense]|uniref:Della protein gai1-like protein n=1 Tax=Trifolium pratense TaxID=57577 RepID=A0A2K3NZG7_TRIPR|nr:della protein gai1-like protein [Trifolium pratense]